MKIKAVVVWCLMLFFLSPMALATQDDFSPLPVTATEAMTDFMRSEETRTCFELRSFLQNVVLKDPSFIKAAENRDTKEVSQATARYALGLAKDYSADFLFYYPNSRFFVQVDDKNYRGRMRIPSDMVDSSSSCFWERLPSSDVAYSVLLKLEDPLAGFLKVSKTLPRMVSNLPDALGTYGKPRVYTALDKEGLNKMAWFKMRQKEPNKAKGAGWCNAESLAFLSAIGNGKILPPQTQKKALSLIDKGKDFVWSDMTLSGGSFLIKSLDGNRLGVIVYTLETPHK